MATDQMQQASFELVQRCAHAAAAASNEFPFLEFNGFLNCFLNLRKYTAICVRMALHAPPLSENGKERRFHRMLFPHAKIVMLVLIVSHPAPTYLVQ